MTIENNEYQISIDCYKDMDNINEEQEFDVETLIVEAPTAQDAWDRADVEIKEGLHGEFLRDHVAYIWEVSEDDRIDED